MLKIFSNLCNKIDYVSKGILVIMILFITIIMLLQVFFRYILNSSLQWSEELMLMNLTWVVFIGGIILMKNWEHANIPTFINLLPIKFRPFLFILAKTLTILFLLTLVWYGIDAFMQNFHAKSPSLKISTRWAKFSIPVGSIFMIILAFNILLKDISSLINKDTEYFKRLGEPQSSE